MPCTSALWVSCLQGSPLIVDQPLVDQQAESNKFSLVAQKVKIGAVKILSVCVSDVSKSNRPIPSIARNH